MGDGLGRLVGDPCVELLEVIGHRVVLLAGMDPADALELQPVLASGEVRAEDVEDRGTREDGELGPDGEEPLLTPEEPAGRGVPALPGDVTAEVDGHARPEGGPGPDHDSIAAWVESRGGGRGRPGGWGACAASNIRFSVRETCRGRWTMARTGRPFRKSQCRQGM